MQRRIEITAKVGDTVQCVPGDIFFAAFEELRDYFHDVVGLRGHALDVAIDESLPRKLDAMINGVSETRH